MTIRRLIVTVDAADEIEAEDLADLFHEAVGDIECPLIESIDGCEPHPDDVVFVKLPAPGPDGESHGWRWSR